VNKAYDHFLFPAVGRWLCIVLLFAVSASSQASHFRFGHFSYRAAPEVSPSTADFTMTVAFRSSAFGHPNIGQTFRPGSFSFGDGRSGRHYYEVIARNLQEDWIVGRAIQTGSGNDYIRHTYPSPNSNGSPWLGSFSSCCKIGAIRNGGNASWRVYTRVNLEDGNSSPVSNLPPIVSCPKYNCRFLVPAVDPDGDTLSWRMSTRSESAIPSIPGGMSIDPNTGIFSWEGAESFSNGLYTVQVTIEDRDENGAVKSTSAVDFLIRLQDQGANSAPAFDHPPTPEAGSVITAIVGQDLTIRVQASDEDSNDVVYLNHVGLPRSATFEQTTSNGSTGIAQLSWTPAVGDIGEHLVTFLANDNRGGAAIPVSIKINVIKPAISDVRVISTIKSSGIEIDNSAFTVQPSSISYLDKQMVVTWEFPSFNVGQLEALVSKLKLFDLEPGEQRLVTESLELHYKDIDGNPVYQKLDEQWVNIAPSLTRIDIETDKTAYAPSEQVRVSAWLTNLSEAQTDAETSLLIMDSQGKLVVDLGRGVTTDLAAGEQRYLPDQYFDTQGFYAGNYQAIARTLDERGDVLQQASAPFALTTQKGDFFNVGALVSADKPRYQAWDQAFIFLRTLNLAENASFDGGEGRLAIYRPGGELLREELYTIGSLSPQDATDRQHSLALVDREVGTYRVVWQVRQDGEMVASSATTFEVERSELQALTGQASVVEYPTGEAKSCHFQTASRSNASPTIATLVYQIASLDSGEVIYEIRENNVSIGTEPAHPYQIMLADPPAYGAYGCILMAEINGELSQLAAAGYEVVPPRLEIDVNRASRGYLLVLMDSETAPHDSEPVEDQRAYLETLLAREGWLFTITDNAENFNREFHSGRYSAVALLSEMVELHPQTEQLLVEANYSGTGVLIGGAWNRRNSQLERALGIKLTGKNNQSSAINLIGKSSGEPGSEVVATGAYALAHCGAQVWAVFNGGKNASSECAYPDGPAAVTAAHYGRGRNSYFAYDVLTEASLRQSLHETLLLRALDTIQPNIWPVAAGRILPIEVTVQSLGRKAAVNVQLTLPAGAALEYADGLIQLSDNAWIWQRDFHAPAEQRRVFYSRVPDGFSGNFVVEIDVDAGLNRSLMVDDSEHSLSFGGAEPQDSENTALSALQALQENAAGQANYIAIRNKLERAAADAQQGKIHKSIKALLLALDKASGLEGATAMDFRLAVGAWLYQLQREL
jgi:hypothetical protein